MEKNDTLVVAAIECKRCGTLVWSRHRHDCRHCTCQACFIDGGRSYTRVGWEPEVGPPVSLTLTLNRETLAVLEVVRHPEPIPSPASPDDTLTEEGDPWPY